MSAWEQSLGGSDEWYTPKWVFDALDCTFDLDVAAPKGASDVTHVKAKAFVSANSLALGWQGFVWMNPPFGGRNGLEPWLEKFFSHRDGIALVPDRTSAPWFQKYAPRAHAVLFVAPKIKFERPDGSTGDSPSTGTALLACGQQAINALERAARGGHGWLVTTLY